MPDPRTLVRTVVEECWSDPADGAKRMASLVSSDYVHHTPYGDWSLDQFFGGLDWLETHFSDRRYRVRHLVVEGPMVAAFIEWSAVRVADGRPIEGRGAYHCRVMDGLVHEDWDVFSPMP